MRIAEIELESVCAYGQSRDHRTPKLDKEKDNAWEERTWRNKLHVNDDGYVVIPAMGIKFAMETAATRLAIAIPGKGNQRYTKNFKSGLLITENPVTNVKAADVNPIVISANPRGKRGVGTRVPRWIPVITSWRSKFIVYVIDNEITPEVFERVLVEAGELIGIGQFRGENGGTQGRFRVMSIKWSDRI